MKERLSEILDKHSPVKKIKLKKNYCSALSEETKQMIKYRNKLRREAEKNNDTEKNREFKAYAKIVKKRVQEDKQRQKEEKLNQINMKETGKEAKKLMNTKEKNKQPDILIEEDKEVTDDGEMAEILNKHYLNKIKQIKENIKNTNHDPKDMLKK